MFHFKDRQLVRAVENRKMALPEAVCRAIADGRLRVLSALMSNADLLDGAKRAAAYGHVIAARNYECLQIMYEADELTHQMTHARLRLLEQMVDAEWDEGLNLVIRRREDDDSTRSLADVLAMDMSDRVRGLFHEHHARWRPSTHLLYHGCAHQPQNVAYYFSLTQNHPVKVDLEHALNLLLDNGAEHAVVLPAVDLLLSKLKDSDNKSFRVMFKLLAKGLTDQAQVFVAAGFSVRDNAKRLYEELGQANAPAAARAYARTLLDTPTLTGEYDGFTREEGDSVSCVQTLSGGQVLTMVFNFATAQQILLVQADKQVAPATAVPFSQIDNKDMLARAAVAFVKTGGDAALVEGIAQHARPALIGKPAVKGAV